MSMPSPQRAAHLAGRGMNALLNGDPVLRRRVLDPLRARVVPVYTEGLDPLVAGYLRGAERAGVDATVATALRTGSELLRTVLRRLAERTGAVTWRAGWAELALAAADPGLRRQGIAVIGELVEQGHAADLTPRQARLYAHALLLEAGETGRGSEVLRRHLPRLRTLPEDEGGDIESDLALLSGDEDTWWRLLTRRWREAGAMVPRLLTEEELAGELEGAADFPGGAPALDRLAPDRRELAERRAGVTARAAQAVGRDLDVSDLPLVSLVVTAYRPGPWLATAIRSLRDQTWPHLEIIVVDDRSGPEHAGSIARSAALDPRARVVTRRRNGGAYRARNHGLAEAKGDYLAFLDADDWSHPERVERQVLPLLADTSLPATSSAAIRAHPDLSLVWPGYPAVRHNSSGILLPRRTLTRVGSFDDVRKSADSEYEERVAAVVGRGPQPVDPPLQVTRLRRDSLSRNDFTVGWAAGPRAGYRDAYRGWHRHLDRLRTQGELPGQPGMQVEYPGGPPPDRALDWATRDTGAGLGRRPGLDRPFAAPHSWLTTRPHAPFDVLVVDDLADAAPGDRGLVAAVERLRDLDLRIALLHREDPSLLRARPAPLSPRMRQLLDTGGDVVRVHPEERVEAGVLWVRRPESLSVDRPPPDVAAEAVVVTEPRELAAHRVPHAWDVTAVMNELDRWGTPGGGDYQWLPDVLAEARVHRLTTHEPEAP